MTVYSLLRSVGTLEVSPASWPGTAGWNVSTVPTLKGRYLPRRRPFFLRWSFHRSVVAPAHCVLH